MNDCMSLLKYQEIFVAYWREGLEYTLKQKVEKVKWSTPK